MPIRSLEYLPLRNPCANIHPHSLFDSGLFADCTVRCGDRTWKLHKHVLCKHSTFYNGAFTGDFDEAKTGVLTLSEDDPEVVDLALRFTYSENCKSLTGHANPITTMSIGDT